MTTVFVICAIALCALILRKVSAFLWPRKVDNVFVARATKTQREYLKNIDEEEDSTVVAGKPRRKASFRTFLVLTAKGKFGTPRRNEANRQAVRKFVYDLCKEHGLKPRHILEHVDIATALVFVHSDEELEAMAVSHTEQTLSQERSANELTGPSYRP